MQENERVTRLETKIDNIEDDFSEHKKSLHELSLTQIAIGKVLTKFSLIEDNNQKFIKEFGPRLNKVERNIWIATGWCSCAILVVTLLIKSGVI